MKPLFLISLALVLLLLAAGCIGESRIGKVVPCSNYHIIEEKYRGMSEGGNIHYFIKDTEGKIFEVFVPDLFPIDIFSSEVYWNKIPVGIQGRFDGQMSRTTLTSLIPENITPLSEGNNFCEVIP